MKKCVNGKYIEVLDKEVSTEEKNESIKSQIDALKTELSNYDYIGVKIAMRVATVDEYAEQIAYTETLRKKIRELEEQLLETQEEKEALEREWGETE